MALAGSGLKLNILHKGLLLLLVPFILQVGLFVVLFAQVTAAEELAEVEAAQTVVLDKFGTLVLDFGHAWASIFNRVFGGPSSARSALSPEQYNQRVTTTIEELKALPHVQGTVQGFLTDFEEIRDGQYQLLKEVSAENPDGKTAPDFLRLTTQLLKLKMGMKKTINKMMSTKIAIDQERQKVVAIRLKDKQARESIKETIIWIFAFQLFVTVCMLVLFLNDISKRLSILVSNARRLPKGEAITVKVRGDDEIAYLDSVIREASGQLIESTQNRQSMMDMIAHDIRSPLMSSELLLNSLTDPKRVAAMDAQTSAQTAKRLRSVYKQMIILVEELLSMDRLEEGTLELDLEMFDLALVAETVKEGLTPQAELKGVELLNLIQTQQVVADERRIFQVLNNFVGNAVKFTPKGGRVVISSDISKERDWIVVSVNDTGRGIDPAQVPHVFEKYYQAKSQDKRQGFGLGLAISKILIEAQGGEVGVESKVGKGSTFWFTLPLEE